MTNMQALNAKHGARALAAACALGAFAALATSCDTTSTASGERDVVIGGLFSLSGNWSTLGRTSAAAMQLAVDDVNSYLAGNPAHVRFVAVIEDTKLDPVLALKEAQSLHAKGAQLLIGPQSSAEVDNLKAYVGANGMLLVSQSSTAGALANVGDNVFRFTPSDSLEGVAVSAMMRDDGIKAIVPVWRDDAGNTGVMTAGRNGFVARGGTALTGVKYDPATEDFTPILADVKAQVQQAIAQFGAERVAIHLAAFDEVAELFSLASGDPVLGAVHWYGSDGVARSEALLANRQAADFASRVGYPNPIFGLDEGARDVWEPLAARIRERTNLEPDAFALAVYDAVWVVGRAFVASGAKLGIDELKQAFATAASTQFGATGWTVLNAAGDRKYGDFDFWAIRQVDGAPGWIRVARYETRTGSLVR